jgi:hypothetical protein
MALSTVAPLSVPVSINQDARRYKQRGQAAIDAYNVFYYMTYEGAVDLDSISGRRTSVSRIVKNTTYATPPLS